MSALRFSLRSNPTERVSLSGLIPSRLAGLSTGDIENLALAGSRDGMKVGDLFWVSGTPGDALVIEGGSPLLDFVGEGLDGGTLTVEGDVGAHAARQMKSGRLDIQGNAGHGLASGMKDGLVTVKGSAGDYVGAAGAGDRFGMAGGIVVVEGNIGERAGDRMRRGTIITRGMTGASAGSRMAGGTIIAEGGLGPMPGALLRRGTLIAPSVAQFLPTFADCGRHDLTIVKILNRHFTAALGDLAPKPLPLVVRRYAGDLATIGKGEILITG